MRAGGISERRTGVDLPRASRDVGVLRSGRLGGEVESGRQLVSTAIRARPAGSRRATVQRALAGLGLVLLAAAVLVACGSSGGSKQISVFSVKAGQCFDTPSTVKVQLSSLTETPCTKPHTQEAYAIVPYVAVGATAGTSAAAVPSSDSSGFDAPYPGDDVLTTFAQGACAQRFSAYVGIDYLDSSLFFTYLLPSARSWESDDDRDVTCFITTTGSKLTRSVKGSKL
jgi:Septum formation